MNLEPTFGQEEVSFLPDNHPWYQSLEHALAYERDGTAHLVTKPGNAETVHTLVSAGFWGTYVWPVFRAWCGK